MHALIFNAANIGAETQSTKTYLKVERKRKNKKGTSKYFIIWIIYRICKGSWHNHARQVGGLCSDKTNTNEYNDSGYMAW